MRYIHHHPLELQNREESQIMNEITTDKDTMWVVTGEPIATRGTGIKQAKPLKVDVLTENIQLFIWQMGNILEKTPEKLGGFNFEELEVHAEVNGKGSVMLFGTGGEIGATGGLRFVFRRTPIPHDVMP
jgi:hypothetical protein